MITESDLIDEIDEETVLDGFTEVQLESDCDIPTWDSAIAQAMHEPSRRSIEERDALISDHLSLAFNEAKKRYRSVHNSVLFGELLSAAYSGLLDAAERFDEDKVHVEAKRPFCCYARRRIQGEMNDYLRSCNWGTRANPQKLTSLDANTYLQSWDESPRPLRDSLQSQNPNPIDELNGIELFDKLIRGLPKSVQEVFRLRFLYGLTMKEVAARREISESRVSQILSQHTVYLGEILAKDRCELWEEALEIRHA